jgi:hypothetical protein
VQEAVEHVRVDVRGEHVLSRVAANGEGNWRRHHRQRQSDQQQDGDKAVDDCAHRAPPVMPRKERIVTC